MRSTIVLTAMLSLPVVCGGQTTSPALEHPASATQPSTQPAMSLVTALYRAVEVAQQKIRTAPPPAPPPRNSFEKGKIADPPNPLKPIAEELVGNEGLIAFRVLDVIDGAVQVVPAPQAVYDHRGKVKYLIIAECDNPTAAYFSEAGLRELRRLKDRGDTKTIAWLRGLAEERKPKHRLWILSDDDRVSKWAQNSRQHIRGQVISASLGRMLHDYVGAELVLKVQEAP